MKQTHRPSPDNHDEGYFASFTDMLVGIIFIFIILLMIVANNFQQATESVTRIQQELQMAQEERNKARDAARDAERDAKRDKLRDAARDAMLDKAIAQGKAFEQAAALAKIPEQIEHSADDTAIIQYGGGIGETKANKDEDIHKYRKRQENLFNEARNKILERLREAMEVRGFTVRVSAGHGALIIPEDQLFYEGDGSLNPVGKEAIRTLAGAMNDYLPCISPTADPYRLSACANLGFTPNDGLDAIFIDDYPDVPGNKEQKLLLAVQHIVSVFGELTNAEHYLDKGLKNTAGMPILNIKVNQQRREEKKWKQEPPIFKNSLVLRFVMRQPNKQDIQRLKESSPH